MFISHSDSLSFSSFLLLYHVPEMDQLKRGQVYFGLWFQKFLSMVTWPITFGPLRGRTLWQEGVTKEADHFMVAGEQKEKEKEGLGSNVPFKCTSSVIFPLASPFKVFATSS